ncbi:hypothetical protein ACT3RT_14000 [Ewingella sp. AOP9-I1-14]
MKNNELTAVKAGMPSLEGLPQEVIEYVLGLVAENVALKERNISNLQFIAEELGDPEFRVEAVQTPNADAFTAELRAQGADTVAEYHKARVDDLIDVCRKRANEHKVSYLAARDVAANLRAGRKG